MLYLRTRTTQLPEIAFDDVGSDLERTLSAPTDVDARTADVRAIRALVALERDDFLSAVTGEREARSAADDIVTRRLTV